MNRRRFLRLVTAGAAGIAVAPLLPLATLPKPKPDGISIRFIRSYDVNDQTTRLDVLYGFSALTPSYSCRVLA